jgi:hypothetical protein
VDFSPSSRHHRGTFLVVIQQIDVGGITLLEAKDNPPGGADSDAPINSQVTPSTDAAGSRASRGVPGASPHQACQNPGNLVGMIRVQLASVVAFVQAPQAAMPKSAYHTRRI